MRIIRNPAHTQPCVLVLGMFDGVHRGHQALLAEGLRLSAKYNMPMYVCTFEPHPLELLFPDRAPKLLTTIPERAALMASYGADAFCLLDFTMETADSAPEAFLRMVKETYSPCAVVCGFNYTFGAKGHGNTDTLRQWGDRNDIEISVVDNVRLEGDTVSSTRIRGLLKEGAVDYAARLMGHYYTEIGRVAQQRDDHELLMPDYRTANVRFPARKMMPGPGVYCCCLTLDGVDWPAIVNVSRSFEVQVHVLDAWLLLSGRRIRLTWLKKLRDESVFPSHDLLIAQIRVDTENAHQYFRRLRS